RALLAPGLLAPAAPLGARLLTLGAGAAAGHIGGHDLMDERLVVGAAERDIRQLDLARGILQLKLHGGLSRRLFLVGLLGRRSGLGRRGFGAGRRGLRFVGRETL